MQKIFSRFNLLFFGLIAVYLLLQLFFLNRIPDIMEDESWYANTAYNFSQGKWFINTVVGHGGGDYFLIYPLILSIGIKLFGCSLAVTRMISVVGGLLSIWGLISILRATKATKPVIALTTLFYIFSNVTYIVYRTTRPESWILVFGIWSVFFLVKFIQTNKSKAIITSTAFASLSFITHPNGILFLLPIGIYLIIHYFRERQISNLLLFCITSFSIIAVHFTVVFLNPAFNYNELLFQLSVRNSFNISDSNLIENITGFFSIYTLGIKRLYILIFEVLILVIGLFYSKRNLLVRYVSLTGLLSLVFSLFVFNDYSSRHFGEIIFYSMLAFALITESLKNTKIKPALIFLGIIYLFNNIAGDLYLIYKKHLNTPYTEIEYHLSRVVPENATLLCPIQFWYPLKNNLCYCEFTKWELTQYKDLESLIQSKTINYVIMTNSIVRGQTGTSGRAEEVDGQTMDFYQYGSRLIEKKGALIDSKNTIGFDTIKVYRISY